MIHKDRQFWIKISIHYSFEILKFNQEVKSSEKVFNVVYRYILKVESYWNIKTLYKNASAKILINGHLSTRIGIHRGFKQGDAFSNGCFNISIDPLIRNIIADRDIRMIRLVTLRSREEVQMKAGGYADDVHTLCGADDDSVKGIFRQYERCN